MEVGAVEKCDPKLVSIRVRMLYLPLRSFRMITGKAMIGRPWKPCSRIISRMGAVSNN